MPQSWSTNLRIFKIERVCNVRHLKQSRILILSKIVDADKMNERERKRKLRVKKFGAPQLIHSHKRLLFSVEMVVRKHSDTYIEREHAFAQNQFSIVCHT